MSELNLKAKCKKMESVDKFITAIYSLEDISNSESLHDDVIQDGIVVGIKYV